MSIINFPIPYINDPDTGKPLINGQVFVGQPDLDPEIVGNQKQLNVVQENGTVIPIPQPAILSQGGRPQYNGDPVRLDVSGNYSIKILDKNGAQKYYIENVFEGQPLTVESQINDLSQTYNFATVAEYKAFTAPLPVGKQVYLADRNAKFTVIAGTATANTFNIIASDSTGQSINLNTKNSIINAAKSGAIADNGVTDNTACFAAIAALALSIFVPKPASGNYYKADIALNDNQAIFSYGAEIRPANIITIKHAATGSVIDGLNITGNGKTDAGAGVIGISALGSLETKTQNVVIKDFKGDGLQRTTGVDRHQGNILTNFTIKDCVTGLNEGTNAEYNKTSAGSIFGCDDGIRVKGGNNNYTGVTVTDNVYGVHLVGGTNDAHGVCSGLTINHNTTANIYTDNITVPSFNFAGCEVWAGDIHLLNSNGVTFTGCSFSIVEIKEENARYCSFSSCHFVSAITVSPNYNGTFSEVYYYSSNIYNDTSLTRPIFFPEGSRSTATLENNLLNLANGSATNILDTLSTNAISGNPLFAWQSMFQTPANVFDGTKKTRYDGSLIHFTGEINVTRPTSYIPEDDVKVQLFSAVRGVVATATLARQSDNGSTLYTNVYRMDAMIARENDTYELRVVNNSGANINVYRDQSADLICYCEAWGW